MSVPDEALNQLHPPEEQDLIFFLFDEDMQQIGGWKNTFTDWSDNDSDCETDD